MFIARDAGGLQAGESGMSVNRVPITGVGDISGRNAEAVLRVRSYGARIPLVLEKIVYKGKYWHIPFAAPLSFASQNTFGISIPLVLTFLWCYSLFWC